MLLKATVESTQDALRAHGADAAAHDAAAMHERPLLARNQARRYGENHTYELSYQRLHLRAHHHCFNLAASASLCQETEPVGSDPQSVRKRGATGPQVEVLATEQIKSDQAML